MSEAGWIRLHRKIRDHWIWPRKGRGARYSHFEAWIDLLLSANHQMQKVNVGGRLVVVARGQFLTSQVHLAKRWRWNRETVSKFLKLLHSDEMADIEASRKTDSGYTLVTICNYEKYQGAVGSESSIQTGNETSDRPATDQQPPGTNNNDKNVKKASRAARPPTASDPRISEFRKWFAVEYEKHFHRPYVCASPGRDSKHVKGLLGGMELDALKAAAIRFFDSDDAFIAKRGHRVDDLLQNINSFTAGNGCAHSVPRKAANDAIW